MEHSSLKQLALYPEGSRFTVKAKNFSDGRIKLLQDISLLEYEKSLKYLKYLNAHDYNIFLSPLFSGGVDILLDDISAETVRQISMDGFESLYYLETSPRNFQAIIRLSEKPLDRPVHSFIYLQLVGLYGADPRSSDLGHPFRIAGFTNCKEKHRFKNGLYPFVKIHAGKQGSCSKGAEYIARIQQGIESGLIELPRPRENIDTPPEKRGERNPSVSSPSGRCDLYVRRIYEGRNKDKKDCDLSALDFKVAVYSLKKGFPVPEIRKAIELHSPSLLSRKIGHVSDYLTLTLKKAEECL